MLSRIVTRVGEISALISTISESTETQAAGLQQVNSSVNEMDKMTQQNAAMVEESTAAARSLANEAEDLNQLITRFKTDLNATSHTSYGTHHLAGTRKSKEWKESLNSKFAVIGNRGVKDGSYAANDYNKSKTLEIHGGRSSWEGNVCYNDNHVNFEQNFTPEGTVKWGPNLDVDDSLFKDDTEANTADMWLTMCSTVTGSGNNYVFTITWD